MSNPWPNSPGISFENTNSPFYSGSKTKPQENMVAAVEPIQKVPGGVMVCEDNTIFVDTSKLYTIRAGRRQAFNNIGNMYWLQ